MKAHRTRWFLFTFLAVNLIACNESKYLQPGQYLYDKSIIKINSSSKNSNKKNKQLVPELKGLLRPAPNSNFLGFRFKLWVYNIMGIPKRKGLRNFLRNKVGEPPILASLSAFEKNRGVLQNHLENRGYFHDSVRLDTVSERGKMTAIYTADIGSQYTIRQVRFPSDSSEISREIQYASKNSLLKPGDPYDLDVIKNERIRTDGTLKQKGYYYFNPDYLFVLVDSTVGDHTANIQIVIKKITPEKAKDVYSIGDITVFVDNDLNLDTNKVKQMSTTYDGYSIVDPNKKFRPIIFTRELIFKSGDLYNRRDHDLALSRLVSLGVFKFVKVRFEESDSLQNRLNTFYYLTTTQKKSIRFEVSGLTTSDNANGGQLSVTWRNRNLFRGAELFTTSFYGGLERQYLGSGQYTNINKLGVDLNLYVPRIISPFTFHSNNAYVSKTKINLGYEYYQRTDQYTLNSVKTSFGYIWKRKAQIEEELTVLGINYVNPTDITPAFQEQLDTNITLARSIERQFIIGPTYNFNINTQLKPNRRPNNFYFNANLDLSANLLGILTGADINKGNVKEIFNTPFSQYIRTEVDFRHYLAFSKNTVLASRLTGGIGYAYGNSSTMPFIKEFFAGGANDIRAFRSRTLGPGSYYAGNRANEFVPDQPGDIKLEANSEIRFKLFSVIRWAFFVDAGNVWTLKEDSSRPGSVFTSNFLDQIAIGVGTGLRLDVSILILRLDLGIPVREPYQPEGSRWVFDTGNMVWNFSIGYPF
jgi:outer membrane protein insertion porin family